MEVHSPDVWLRVEAGEVDLYVVVAGDGAVQGGVPRHYGVLEEDVAVVHLESDRNTGMLSG